MCIPVIINDEIKLTTKAGITDTSLRCEKWLASDPRKEAYEELFKYFIDAGWTPMFEWCSEDDRIILEYRDSELIFLTARNNMLGDYVTDDVVEELQEKFSNIPFVKRLENINVETLKTEEDKEGVVIQFSNGHMVKIKTDWYCLLHRSKEICSHEKNILEIILNDSLDDLLPCLSEERKQTITKYASIVNQTIESNTILLSNELSYCKEAFSNEENPRKAVALHIVGKMNSMGLSELLPVFWKCFDNASISIHETLITKMINKCGSNNSVHDIRNLIGAIYD
jgi:RNA ligase